MQLCVEAVIVLVGVVMVTASTWIYRRRRNRWSLAFLIASVLLAGWCLLISAIVAGVVPLVAHAG
jgi:LPXTG-motif cell wall-anchored protein